jgi:hypothetical protein
MVARMPSRPIWLDQVQDRPGKVGILDAPLVLDKERVDTGRAEVLHNDHILYFQKHQ